MLHCETTSRLANAVAREVHQAFDEYQNQFHQITRRAYDHFAHRNWPGIQADSAARLDVYQQSITRIVDRVHSTLKGRVTSRLLWASIKAVYSGLIEHRDDWEVAETFFNSVTRRVFTTVGVDEEIEFVHTDYVSPPTAPKSPVYQTFHVDHTLALLIQQIFTQYKLPIGNEEIGHEAKIAADEIARRLANLGQNNAIDRIDLLKAPFYRGEHVHLIGRMAINDGVFPLVFCFRHTNVGVFLGAVLIEQDDVSMLFSYTRSYFFC